MKDLGHFDQNIYFQGLEACDWGSDPLEDVSDLSYPAYMQTLPKDPQTLGGISYLYLSNLNRFQIYSYLEGGKDEDGYDTGIVGRGLDCGGKVCSFGKSFFDTPLDRSIEEYEKELFERAKAGSKQ
jgi:hypothetical protein